MVSNGSYKDTKEEPVLIDYAEGAVDSTIEKNPWYKRLLTLIEVDIEETKDLSLLQQFLYNFDLRPVEESRRTWSWYNYVCFWIADSFNINTWQIAATGVEAGMTWWQTWLSVWLGYFLTGFFVSFNARIGIYNHISFPVAIRAPFGIFGSLWPILNRVVMSCVWYSVQAWVGGQCVQVMLRSIFGQNIDKTMHNTFGPNAGVNTFEYLSFFLFWLFSLPALYFPPHQIRHLFTIKSYVVPVAGISFLVWTLVKAKGAGPVIHEKSKLHGSDLAWAFIISTMNCLANFATLITNAPDFSRFADKPSTAIKYWVYIASIPLCFSITCLIGILVSSASLLLYGEVLWSPLEVLDNFLNDYTPGNRGGSFLIAFSFALAQLGTNISANSLSFGTDVTAMLPRFLNIRRGSFLCAALALCICPWKLMASSSKFTTVLSAYAVFLSSISGVVACDYYVIRKGFIELTHLYTMNVNVTEGKKTTSYYRYNFAGCNWRAFAAYICGILPNMVGFVGATGLSVPENATKVYNLSFLVGFGVSFIIYYILMVWVAPVHHGVPESNLKLKFNNSWYEEWKEVDHFQEEMLDNSPTMLEAVRSVERVASNGKSREDMGSMISPITSY